MKKKWLWMIWSVLLVLCALPLRAAIPAQERAALIAFYNSTHGDSWTRRYGWKTAPLHSDGFAMPGTEHTWAGVYMSGDHVRTIYMYNNNMNGSLPPEIGNLLYLYTLNLCVNQISGPLPREIGNLTELRYVYITQNQLTGPLPSSLGQLSHLEYISLSSNKLSGTIPSGLANLGNLRSLSLSNNNLIGTIPADICFIPLIQDLDLSNNQLEGTIPAGIGNLPYLHRLDLGNNRLTGTIPVSLGTPPSLTYLRLSHNQLSGTIPSTLGAVSLLQYLFLNNNNLTGTIPRELGGLIKLLNLDFSYNRLSGSIPATLGKMKELRTLILNDNRLTGSIPSDLGQLPLLNELRLGTNQLSGSIPTSLGNLLDLNYLSISENQLSGTIPAELGKLLYLYHLSIRDNKLTGEIPAQLGDLYNLITLTLRNNQLSGTIPYQLGKLVNLTTFRLNNNFLTGEIPENLMNLNVLVTLDLNDNCLRASGSTLKRWLDSRNPGWETTQNQCNASTPAILLDRTHLNFGNQASAEPTAPQTLMISNSGGGSLVWSVSSSANWLSITPKSGTGSAELSVSVNTTNLTPGQYTGTLNFIAPNASNSPQSVTVQLQIYEEGATDVPFGEFATPLGGATVSNSIAVTGWALDDTGIASVKIYNGESFIGDATLVEGARPDVEAAFPTYPNNHKAGWGYMLLTHFLPNGGNGTYTLVAKATDLEGHEVILGSKTIYVDNAHAVKPFGAIDTPSQGGAAKGKEYVNFGWALTPVPNAIPTNGSTIQVIVDGVVRGTVTYNALRTDIAGLFPGYANSNGAGGSFLLDTTKLSNGIHTIGWNVTDSGGNSDGIGSRYFTVFNATHDTSTQAITPIIPGPKNKNLIQATEMKGDIDDINMVQETLEMEPLLVDLKNSDFFILEGYSLVQETLQVLPVGSTLDATTGIFYWLPGPGFVGRYDFLFIGKDEQGQRKQKRITINIKPKE